MAAGCAAIADGEAIALRTYDGSSESMSGMTFTECAFAAAMMSASSAIVGTLMLLSVLSVPHFGWVAAKEAGLGMKDALPASKVWAPTQAQRLCCECGA